MGWYYSYFSHPMKKFRLQLCIALFATFYFSFLYSAQATEPATRSPQTIVDLRKTHDALFDSYFPVHTFDSNPKIRSILEKERDEAWLVFSHDPQISRMLSLFANLPRFCDQFQSVSIQSFINKTGKNSYQEFSPEQRSQFLYLLHTSESNQIRAAAMMLRNSYLAATYHSDEVMTAVTGVTIPPTVHPNIDQFVSQNSPVLPRGKLSYDAGKAELECRVCRIDYLVIGSGPAGSVIASELRKTGSIVVVVDRGPFVLPGALETRTFARLQEADGKRTSQDGAIYFRNGNALGGGTTVNVDLAFSPTLDAVKDRIQHWVEEGRIRADEFSPEQVNRAYQWVMQQIGTRTLNRDEINANNRVLWDGAQRLHLHPKLYHLNTYAPTTSPYVITDKKSALSQLLLPAMLDQRNPITVLPDTEVLRILFDRTKGSLNAIGVEAKMVPEWQQDGVIQDPYHLSIPTGTTFFIHASNVILAAGALGSSTILLRSGVPNRLIGKEIVIHPSMPLIGVMKRKTHILQGTQASVYVDDFLRTKGIAFEAMSADPGYAAIMLMGDRDTNFHVTSEYSRLAGFGVMLIDKPAPGNQVVLDSNGNPEIEYKLTDEAKKRFRFGIEKAARIMFAAGAERVYIPSNENIFHFKDPHLRVIELTSVSQIPALENLQFIPNRTIVTSAHMQSTDKIGDSPFDSVTSPDFKIWGTRNLYLMDSSIFPESIGANPMQSIYTFAKIFADSLKSISASN